MSYKKSLSFEDYLDKVLLEEWGVPTGTIKDVYTEYDFIKAEEAVKKQQAKAEMQALMDGGAFRLNLAQAQQVAEVRQVPEADVGLPTMVRRRDPMKLDLGRVREQREAEAQRGFLEGDGLPPLRTSRGEAPRPLLHQQQAQAAGLHLPAVGLAEDNNYIPGIEWTSSDHSMSPRSPRQGS